MCILLVIVESSKEQAAGFYTGPGHAANEGKTAEWPAALPHIRSGMHDERQHAAAWPKCGTVDGLGEIGSDVPFPVVVIIRSR